MPYLTEDWGNPSSPHRFGYRAREAVERARGRVAKCLGVKPTEVVFTSSGTEADNAALRGAAETFSHKGNHLIVSQIEHPAVLNTAKALEKVGCRITYLPVKPQGVVDLSALKAAICNQTLLVSIMHANNETGVIQPIEEIASITRAAGVLLHTDAVQSLGKLPIEPAALGADMLSVSAHKILGPKGVGALVVREGIGLQPMMTGGGQERGYRAGTENVAAIVGFAEALTRALEAVEGESRRLAGLRALLELKVQQAIPKVRFNGKEAPRVSNTSNMSFSGVDGESIVLGLDVQGIAVSSGSACSTGDPEPSHVLLSMGLSRIDAQGSVRISLGRDTSEKDIETTVRTLASTVSRLRNISGL